MPSAAAVAAAGALPTTNPLGQPVTLFACTEIMRERADGAAVLPLFFEHAEAQEAVAMAVAADGAGSDLRRVKESRGVLAQQQNGAG